MLNMTALSRMVDDQGRPYFLWDVDMDLERFKRLLADHDPKVQAYAMGKLLRQAKPDDVFQFVTLGQIRDRWDDLERYLGDKLEFWRWLLQRWEHVDADGA